MLPACKEALPGCSPSHPSYHAPPILRLPTLPAGTPGERSSGNTPGPGLPELDAAGGLAMTISGVPQRTVDTLAAVAASQVAALSAGGSQVGGGAVVMAACQARRRLGCRRRAVAGAAEQQ